jgi:hypothetical protein
MAYANRIAHVVLNESRFTLLSPGILGRTCKAGRRSE